VNIIRQWLRQPHARLIALIGLVLIMPLCLRAALGWSNPHGYLSDLCIGSLLIVLLHRRPWWLALPILLAWGLMTVASAELVSAVGEYELSKGFGQSNLRIKEINDAIRRLDVRLAEIREQLQPPAAPPEVEAARLPALDEESTAGQESTQ